MLLVGTGVVTGRHSLILLQAVARDGGTRLSAAVPTSGIKPITRLMGHVFGLAFELLFFFLGFSFGKDKSNNRCLGVTRGRQT